MKEFELNTQLYVHHIQGWYLDEELIDGVKDQFANEINSPNTKTIKFSVPRSYHFGRLSLVEENLRNKFFHQILTAWSYYKKKYVELGKSSIELLKDVNLQYWEPGDHYCVVHCEATDYASSTRAVVFLTYLNDVEKDGETHFVHHGIKIKPKKGLTIFWPTVYTHPHLGLPTNEEKYVATGWFEYIPSNPYENYITFDQVDRKIEKFVYE